MACEMRQPRTTRHKKKTRILHLPSMYLEYFLAQSFNWLCRRAVLSDHAQGSAAWLSFPRRRRSLPCWLSLCHLSLPQAKNQTLSAVVMCAANTENSSISHGVKASGCSSMARLIAPSAIHVTAWTSSASIMTLPVQPVSLHSV